MPLPATAVHPEGPRYRAALLFLPGLWSGPDIWRGVASFLAHRGWEGYLLGRAAPDAVAAFAGELERAVVLVGHDGGGIAALQAAPRLRAAAVVWAAPVAPAGRAVRAAISPWRVLSAMALRTDVPRPAAWARGVPGVPSWTTDREAAAPVVDLVRGRVTLEPLGVPTALIAGEDDALCGTADRSRLAERLQADVVEVPGPGRAPFAGPHWQRAAGLLHRWLVQRLGEELLELYEEAMADREAGDEAE
jgi:pimeloyl-ACP methyl ester carboxylesterase